jgi:hypothetical protein
MSTVIYAYDKPRGDQSVCFILNGQRKIRRGFYKDGVFWDRNIGYTVKDLSCWLEYHPIRQN